MLKLKNQRRFPDAEAVLAVLLVVVIGATGYFAYQAHRHKTSVPVTIQTMQKVPASAPTPMTNPCNLTSTLEIENCLTKELQSANASMLAAVKNLAPRNDLTMAQFNWEAYRAAECQYEGSFFSGGSAEPVAIADCQVRLTRNRLQELLELAQDPAEQSAKRSATGN